MSFILYVLVGLCQNRKCSIQALKGLRPTFVWKLKIWSLFGMHPSLNVSVLNLMTFIESSNGPRCAFSTLVFKKTCTLIVCDVPTFRFRTSLEEVLHETQSDLQFEHELFGFWVVMNIIKGIARGGSPCMRTPSSPTP